MFLYLPHIISRVLVGIKDQHLRHTKGPRRRWVTNATSLLARPHFSSLIPLSPSVVLLRTDRRSLLRVTILCPSLCPTSDKVQQTSSFWCGTPKANRAKEREAKGQTTGHVSVAWSEPQHKPHASVILCCAVRVVQMVLRGKNKKL